MLVITSKGLKVTDVSGLGVSQVVIGKDTQFSVPLLNDYSPVTLEVKTSPETLRRARRLSEPDDMRAFVQVQVTYTDLSGRTLRRVYNRAFHADHDRLTLLP